MVHTLVVILAVAATSVARAEPEPHRVTRIRATLPFTSLSIYRGELRDGAGIPLLGVTASHERGWFVIDAGVRADMIQAGLGRVADLRAGARHPLAGPIDGVALVGVRMLSYTPGGDGYGGTERVLAATAAGAFEISRRVSGTHFTLRVIGTASKKLDREMTGGAVKGGAFGMEYGFEGGVEIGAAL